MNIAAFLPLFEKKNHLLLCNYSVSLLSFIIFYISGLENFVQYIYHKKSIVYIVILMFLFYRFV
jgi:hypothetical protein